MKTFVLAVFFLSINSHLIAQTLDQIAIGSCSHEYDDKQMWPYVMQNDPDLWIWLGDIIYGDSKNPKVLKKKYDQQKANPDYQKMISQMPVIGIWDDHDYGVNDGGKEFSAKKESKVLLQEFLDVPKDNPVFGHEGAYNSYVYGEGEKKVKVILLDARYFRDPLEKNPAKGKRYTINETGDILGEEQWSWLENELTNSDARINIICSGIQIIPEVQGFEKWANFPTARKRFFDLIAKTKPQGAFLLSGDRHIAEFSKYEVEGLGYPLYEYTSSGLTHTWREPWEEENPYRVDELIIEKNFGLIKFEWGEKVKITFEVRGTDNELFQSTTFEL